MKSLKDVQQDMSDLYDAVRNGAVDTKHASELANIAGKYLKAEQLLLAREVFTANMQQRVISAEVPKVLEGGEE